MCSTNLILQLLNTPMWYHTFQMHLNPLWYYNCHKASQNIYHYCQKHLLSWLFFHSFLNQCHIPASSFFFEQKKNPSKSILASQFSSCLTPDVYLCLQSNIWFDQICSAWEACRLASNNSSLLETVNVFTDGGDITLGQQMTCWSPVNVWLVDFIYYVMMNYCRRKLKVCHIILIMKTRKLGSKPRSCVKNYT